MKKSTRIISLILSILMILSLMSTIVMADTQVKDLPENSIYFHLGLRYMSLSEGDTIQVEIPALGEGLYNVTYGVNAVHNFTQMSNVTQDGWNVYFGPGEQVWKTNDYETDSVYFAGGNGNVKHNLHYYGYYSGANYVNPVTNLADIDTELQTTLSVYRNMTGNIPLITHGRTADQTDISWEGVSFNGTNFLDGQVQPLNLLIKGCIFNSPVNYSSGSIVVNGDAPKNVDIQECYFYGNKAGQYVYVYGCADNKVTINNCSVVANNGSNNGFIVKDSTDVNITNNVFNATAQQYYIYYVSTTLSKTNITGTINITGNTFHNVGKVGVLLELDNIGGQTDEFVLNVQDNIITSSWGMAMFRLKLPATVNTTTTKIHFNRNRFDACNYPFYYDIYCGGGEQMFDVSNNWFKSINPNAGFISTKDYGGVIDYRNNYFSQVPNSTQQYGNGNTYKFTPFYIDEDFSIRSNKINFSLNSGKVDHQSLKFTDTVFKNTTSYDFNPTTNYKNTFVIKKDGETVTSPVSLDFGENTFEIIATSFDKTVTKTYTAIITRLESSVEIVPDVTLNVQGSGYIDFGDDVISSTANYGANKLQLGQLVELTARNNAGEFLYWKDDANDKIISESPVYSFAVSGTVSVTAVFTTGETDSRIITYKNTNGAILKSGVVANGEYLAPPSTNPISFGFTFVGWSMTEQEIKDTVGNVEVIAVYENSDNYYSVNVVDGYVKNADVEQDGKYCQLTKVFVWPQEPAKGMKFAYWKDTNTGEIRNYNEMYDFHITENMYLTAVYIPENEEINPTPILNIVNSFADVDNSRITFTSERYVPEEYTVVSHGIILTNSQSVFESNNDFVIGGQDVLKGTASTVGTVGKYALTKVNVAENERWFAKAYLIYTTDKGSTHILYSDPVEKVLKEFIKSSTSLNALRITSGQTEYLTQVSGPTIDLDYYVTSGNADETTLSWSSSNPSVAQVVGENRIKILKSGYSYLTLNATRSDTGATKSVKYTINVLGDEGYVDVCDKAGTLYADDMVNKFRTQVFDIDPVTKDVYYAVGETDESFLTIYRITPDGTKTSMKLNYFGHGTTLSVERDGDDVWLWTGCNSDSGVCRMKYVPGGEVDNYSGTFYSCSFVFAMDTTNRTIITYNVGTTDPPTYSVYDLDDFIANGTNAHAMATVSRPSQCAVYQYQCIDIMGKYMYLYYTVGNTAGTATSGDELDCRVLCIDIMADTLVYEGNVLSTKGAPFSEAEGIQIIKDSDGVVRAYCQINVQTSDSANNGARIYRIS